MKIELNGDFFEVSERTSLSELLKLKDSPETGIAVAVNYTVIPRHSWNTTLLQESDKVLLIKASQGG